MAFIEASKPDSVVRGTSGLTAHLRIRNAGRPARNAPNFVSILLEDLRRHYEVLARMNKAAVLRKIVERLTSDLELYLKAARAAHFEATHEQSKAENKYDTRGLEASYLARGQSRQAAELELAVQQFQRLSSSSWPDGQPADIGALVELRSRRQSQWYLLGPAPAAQRSRRTDTKSR